MPQQVEAEDASGLPTNAVRSACWTSGASAALAAVLTLVLVILVVRGFRQFLGYDSFWHVFIARQEHWRNFWREVADNAHPPLFYLALKGAVALFGRTLIAYRAVSIAATLVSMVLVARIVARATNRAPISVAAAAAFGLSFNVVDTGLEVRAYSLSVAFMLVAFSAYAEWLGTHPGRFGACTRVVFAAAATAAILTHYSAFFFLAAAVVTPAGLSCSHGMWRVRLRHELRHHAFASALMFGAPLAVAFAAYLIHVRAWGASRLNHVPGFLYDAQTESRLAFVARGTRSLALLFLPGGSLGAAATIVVAAFAFLVLWLALRRAVRGHVCATFTAILFALNIAAALASRYPYGGPLRHEIFLFPFVIISLFIGIDSVRRLFPTPWSSVAAWTCVASAGVAVSCWLWVSTVRVESAPLMARQIERFHQTLGSPSAVLVDQFSFTLLFSHYHDWDWHLGAEHVRRNMWQIWSVSKSNRVIHVCRSRQWQLDFSDLSAYDEMRQCLEQSGAQQVAVFRPQQSGFTPSWKSSDTPELAATLGLKLWLVPASVVVDGPDVYASFQPISNSPSAASISILEATYGANCRARAGNASSQLRLACEGRAQCVFRPDPAVMNDPAPGCAKNFLVTWTCRESASPRHIALAPEAAFGGAALITCVP